jgi:hypothetical protein
MLAKDMVVNPDENPPQAVIAAVIAEHRAGRWRGSQDRC